MLLGVFFASRLTFAGFAEDIELAADTSKPIDLRQGAFTRLHVDEATSILVGTANDATASAGRRWVSVRVLGKVPSGDAETALIEFLASENAQTRIAACFALGERGNKSVSGRLAARLEDKALLVRQAAADGLGLLRDPATLPDLARALGEPSNHYRGSSMWVRRHYVEAMGSIGTDAAIAPLANALDDADAEVSRAAVAGLEKVAGFSYRDGRTPAEAAEAWRRWAKGR